MKKFIIATTAIAGSFLAGYGVSSYLNKTLASTIGIATGSGLFSAGLCYMIMDNRHTNMKNDLQNKLDNLQSEFNKLSLSKDDALKGYALTENLLKASRELVEKLEAEISKLETSNRENREEIAIITAEANQVKFNLEAVIVDLQSKLANAIAQRDEFKATAEQANKEVAALNEDFQYDVEIKVNELYKTRLVQETKDQFALLQETIDCIRDMQQFTNKVYHKHDAQKIYADGLTDTFHAYKNKCDASAQAAFNDLQSEKAGLEHQLALLKRQLADGMTEPQYKDFGLVSDEGRVINGLIEWSWRNLNVPLKALAFDSSDEITSFGLDYPKSQQPQTIVETLQNHIDTLTKYLGIFKILRIEYLPKYDAIAVSYRHTAPKPDSDDDIYKAGLLPRSMFCDAIFKATDHKSGGKPTLRIMAATGEGKGICTKHIVAYFAEIPDWETWVSDPVHGLDQDYWDCPKVAKNKAQAIEAFGEFAKLHATRKDLKIDGFTSNSVLGIFDEFDKQHEADDKAMVSEIMTAIRHTKQRQILIGQSAEVKENGWTWDMMKNCSHLVLGASIGTIQKHLKNDFGWTLKKANEVKRQMEKFEDWATKKNDSNPDLPPENITRIGLLITGNQYQFVELPIPHKGIIRNERVRESLSKNTQSHASTNIIDAAKVETKKAFVIPHIECPHCGSTKFTRKDKVKDPTMYTYLCKSCNKRFTSYNNKPANSN